MQINARFVNLEINAGNCLDKISLFLKKNPGFSFTRQFFLKKHLIVRKRRTSFEKMNDFIWLAFHTFVSSLTKKFILFFRERDQKPPSSLWGILRHLPALFFSLEVLRLFSLFTGRFQILVPLWVSFAVCIWIFRHQLFGFFGPLRCWNFDHTDSSSNSHVF